MPPLSIMIKPASALCNMRCEYCFYHDVTDHRDVKSFGLMSEETAENLIEKALSFANGESIAFAFQGGEPTIRGLDFFRFFCKRKEEAVAKPVCFCRGANAAPCTPGARACGILYWQVVCVCGGGSTHVSQSFTLCRLFWRQEG